MKRALAMSAGLFLAVGSAAAQSSLKVYVEGSDAATALRILHERCPICSAVIKKDGANFIVLLASTDGKTDLSLFETASGSLVKQTTAETLDSAIASALEAMRSYTPAPKNAAVAPGTGNATVYVYRYKQFVGAAIEPSVFCDETEVARMDNGRYFTVDLKPGKHVFRSNDKQSGIELDAAPGAAYYLRVEIATGFMKGHGRLVLVQPGQGSVEIRKLQPLGEDKVKDNSLVKAQR